MKREKTISSSKVRRPHGKSSDREKEDGQLEVRLEGGENLNRKQISLGIKREYTKKKKRITDRSKAKGKEKSSKKEYVFQPKTRQSL